MGKVVRKFNWLDIKPDQELNPETGWINLEVRWVATEETCGTQAVTFGRVIYRPQPGGVSSHVLHRHPNAEEVIHILHGTGHAIIGTEEHTVGAGDVLFIPKGEQHTLECGSQDPLEVVLVYAAPSLEKAGYELTSAE